MQWIAIMIMGTFVAGCSPSEPGSAIKAESEALNQAAADLDAQSLPPVGLVDPESK